VGALVKSITAALAAARPHAAAAAAASGAGAYVPPEPDTIRTIVTLLSPGSPLLLTAAAAISTLQRLTSRPHFAAHALATYDADFGEVGGGGGGSGAAGGAHPS
jgi:hypothetical protein